MTRTISIRAAAFLFLVPLLVWLFTAFELGRQDAAFQAATQVPELTSEQSHAAALAAFRTTPPASVCESSGDEALDQFRATYCKPFSAQWQLVKAHQTAKFMLFAGAALLLALGAASFAAPDRSVKAVLRTAFAATAIEALVQAAMLVWLVYWIPARLWHVQLPWLAMLVGLVALAALALVLRQAWACTRSSESLHGEIITPADEPSIWARVHHVAKRINVTPPRHLVVTTDANFYVTDERSQVKDRPLTGRTLVASLPLLRILDVEEADALLAHELAHFAGGAQTSAPAMARFNRFADMMESSASGRIAVSLLSLVRMVMMRALEKPEREGHLVADLVASRATAPAAVARALIKHAAFSAFRALVPRQDHAAVKDGLPRFAYSPSLADAMATVRVAHPFHRYPALDERIGSVGAPIDPAEYSAVLLTCSDGGWLTGSVHMARAEERLWAPRAA